MTKARCRVTLRLRWAPSGRMLRVEMAAKKKARKASGRNIAEHERNTERVTVRLDPEAMEQLRHYAAAWKCPMSDVVASALDSLDNDKTIQAAMAAAAKHARRVGEDRGKRTGIKRAKKVTR